MHLGPWELALVLGIVLIIFGIGRLPQSIKSLGKVVKEFRRGQKEIDEAMKDSDTNKT